jgi:transcriptional regulator with XRE-family HTH domain
MDKSWIRNQMLDKRINQKKLAEMLGIDAGAVSRMLSGERKLQLAEAATLSLIFGETLDEILFRFGVIGDAGSVSVKLSGTVDSDGDLTALDEAISIPPPPSTIGSLNCAQIRGDTFLDRALVFYGDPVAVVNDRLGMLLLPGGRRVLGMAYKGYLPNKYNVKLLCGKEITDTDIVSMCIVADITPL